MPPLYTNAAMRGFGKYGTIPSSSHAWFVSKKTFVRGSTDAKRKMKLVRSFKPSGQRSNSSRKFKKELKGYRTYNISGLFK